jgi:hypothetical protein
MMAGVYVRGLHVFDCSAAPHMRSVSVVKWCRREAVNEARWALGSGRLLLGMAIDRHPRGSRASPHCHVSRVLCLQSGMTDCSFQLDAFAGIGAVDCGLSELSVTSNPCLMRNSPQRA